MLIGACYTRVSTDDQLEFSLDAQLKAIKEYAKKNDILLSKEHIYVDEGISGKRADKRPAFMEMIATAKLKPKPFDIILVHKFDRFARSREDSIVYKSLLRKECGVKVTSITEQMEDDKFSVILEAMLEAMAEYYSLNLSDEVKKGMTEKAHRGEPQTKAPFGYDMVKGRYYINPEEAKIIQLIFSKVSSREMTIREMAVYLNSMGITTKNGNPFENRNIDYIINNPVYIGYTRWSTDGKVSRDWNRNSIIKAKGEHEPIISEELWNQTQQVIKENKELHPRGIKENAPIHTWLKGLVRCGECGHTFVKIGKYKDNTYLNCNGYQKGMCKTSSRILVSTLEALVLEEIKKAYTGEININIVPKKTEETSRQEYELLQNTLLKLDERLQRAKNAYLDGIDSQEEYGKNKHKIEDDLIHTRERLEALKDSLLNPDGKPFTKQIKNAHALLTDPNMDPETKYNTAHFLVDKITYSKKEQVLKIRFK